MGEEAGDLGVLEELDQRMVAHDLSQAADQRRAGSIAAGMDDPGPSVGGFEPEPEPPVGPAVENRAQGQKLINSVWAFTCEDSDGFGVGQAIAGRHGVGRVLARAVAGSERDRNTALRPGAGAVGERFFGHENGGLPLGSETPGRPQAGNPGTHNHGAGGRHSPTNITALRGGIITKRLTTEAQRSLAVTETLFVSSW